MTSRMAGQTINDRFLAAKHSIAGQGLAKSVCKATTEEMIGPKKKHLDYLVHCTNEPNVSIPQMANLLIERSQNTNWIVVYKALVTVHHIMCYGNERFTQYLASSNCTFQLSNFFDKSGVQGALGARTGYDMSPFIRRYARYLNEKALSYRTVAFDFCKVKRGKEDGLLRTMNAEKLLKTLPCLQSQLDALLEFDCSANDLSNGVINMCFMLLFRDLIRLFACYNDGIINLLEKYFDMNKKQCREGLDIYKKFLIRMDRVAEFLRVAENVGIDKGDIPDLTKAPSSLLDALEQHLASLEGKKTSTSSTPSQSSSSQKSLRSGMSALSSTSNAFGTVVANGRLDSHTNGLDETVKQQLLAEEEAAMSQFKSKVNSPNSSNNNPFLNNSTSINASAQHSSMPTVDLLESDPILHNSSNKTSDDLLQLGNPFVDAFAPVNPPVVAAAQPNNLWLTNGNSYGKPQQPVITNGAFVSDSNFASVFGSTETKTAEDSSQSSSFNPFLVDDPTPSLFLDTDSPQSECKPIKDVLEYFQKDNSIKASQTEDAIPTTSNKPAELINAADSIQEEPEPTDVIIDNNTKTEPEPLQKPVAKKSAPPPRPPPPTRSYSKSTIEIVNTTPDDHPSIVNNPDNNMIPAPGIPSDNNFPSVFTANEGVPVVTQNTAISSQLSAFDGLGGVLQPSTQTGQVNQATTPNNNTTNNNQQLSGALITGDLDSSLASLAENLTIRAPQVKGVQWNSPKNGSKTGTSWTPQPLAATTGAGYKPMNQAMTSPQQSPQPMLQQPMFSPQIQPMMGMRPMVSNATMFPPRMGMIAGGAPAAATMNPMGQQQSLLFN